MLYLIKQLPAKFNGEGEVAMTFEQMLLKRESCRSYRDQPVSREDLIKICEAGRLTPSGCNAQPWKFMVIDEAEARDKLYDALLLDGGIPGAPWREECPAFIVLVEQKATLMPAAMEYYKNSQRFAQGDIGMASLNMCYQAMELGLSTCMIGMNDQKKMEEYFGIPEGSAVRLVLAVEYPKTEAPAREKIRKPFDEVVSFNKW